MDTAFTFYEMKAISSRSSSSLIAPSRAVAAMTKMKAIAFLSNSLWIDPSGAVAAMMVS